MKKVILWTLFFLPVFVSAQSLKLSSGITTSNLQDDNWYTKAKNGFNLRVGLDYLEHRYFYLSSEIGYLTSGTKVPYRDQYSPVTVGYWPMTCKNFHVNTTFRARIQPTNNFGLFIGVGPKWDYQFDSSEEGYRYHYKKKGMFGMKSEAGVYYDFNKFRVGAEYARLTNFQHSYESVKSYSNLYNITLGYRIK